MAPDVRAGPATAMVPTGIGATLHSDDVGIRGGDLDGDAAAANFAR